MARVSLATSIVVLAICTQATAKPGDAYHCVTKLFDSNSLTTSRDAAFEAANMEKTFDVLELTGQYKVYSNSSTFEPATHTYKTVADRISATLSVEMSKKNSMETFVFSRVARKDIGYTATIVSQSDSYVKTWYLSCVLSN
jgi:hypothetical protein